MISSIQLNYGFYEEPTLSQIQSIFDKENKAKKIIMEELKKLPNNISRRRVLKHTFEYFEK